MATTIDHLTFIISVPQADLTFISGTLYELDTDAFRLNVAAILASEEGIVLEDAYIHNVPVTVAGTTFARTLEFISPYSIQFTPDAQYSVRLVGSNNNIFEVENGILVQNQVQVIPTNSGGLVVPATLGGQLEDVVWIAFQLDRDLRDDNYHFEFKNVLHVEVPTPGRTEADFRKTVIEKYEDIEGE